MLDSVVGHLVRRSFQTQNDAVEPTKTPEGVKFEDVSAAGFTLMMVTAVMFIGAMATIRYTYGSVIATLTMVESPVAEYAPVESDDTVDSKLPKDPEVLLVKQAPITSTLRGARKHLRARAGKFSGFRGASLAFVWTFATANISHLLTAVLPGSQHVTEHIAVVLASVLTSYLAMQWTHIVISEPSPKYWMRRGGSLKLWKKVMVPSALLAIAEQLAIALPSRLYQAWGLSKFAEDPEYARGLVQAELVVALLKVVAVGVLGFAIALALVIPAEVTLTRIQASLISEEEETIVPFDRSFGGRVVPVSAGGSGVISMLEAWKTFDGSARVRLIKLYLKVIFLQTVVLLIGSMVIMTELSFFDPEFTGKYAAIINKRWL